MQKARKLPGACGARPGGCGTTRQLTQPVRPEVPAMKNQTADRRRLWGAAAFTCLALLLGSSDAPAAEPAWKVGLAQVKITPEQPVRMSGYAGRTKPFEKVAADLF